MGLYHGYFAWNEKIPPPADKNLPLPGPAGGRGSPPLSGIKRHPWQEIPVQMWKDLRKCCCREKGPLSYFWPGSSE
jgi:hypothetical protein